MIQVFIGYGGSRAEEVAKHLNAFLQRENLLYTFLASPDSHSLVSTDDFKIEIDKNLLDCNIVVFVCHKNTSRSREAKREIDLLFQRNLQHKIISFAETHTCIPKRLRQRWCRLHFAPEKPEESFCRLLNEIFRCFITIQLPRARIVKEEERMV